MPREYDRKGGPGGRPPTDDRPIARGVLFAHRIMGRDLGEVTQAATQVLLQARAADAARAEAAGARKAVIGRDSARRRVKEVVADEAAEQGNDRLTGLPSNIREAGRHLEGIAHRDGFAAARAVLVGVISHGLAWGGAVTDLAIRHECDLAAEAWVSSIEASLPSR